MVFVYARQVMTVLKKCLRHFINKIFLLANMATALEFLFIYRMYPGPDIYTGVTYCMKGYMDRIQENTSKD